MLGFVAIFLSVAFIWPQVFRVFAKNSIEGLSVSSLLQGSSGSVAWAIYGIYKPNIQLTFAHTTIVVAIVFILTVCVRHKAIAWWLPILALTIVAIIAIVVAQYSITILGWLTIMIGTPAIIPQVVHVYRTDHLYGVSAPMYALLFVNCATWFSYGALIGDWFVALPNIVGMLGAVYIWIQATKSHHKFAVPIEATAN